MPDQITYQFRPLRWTGPVTPHAQRRPGYTFRAGYEDTLDLLFREIGQLDGTNVVIEVDIAERDIRVDGLPKARARWGSNPGVVVSFASRFGPLRYATDSFTDWQANLRAVALSLEALRKVDRYGVSKRGEQYTGWKAIEASRNGHFATADAAADWMRQYAALTLRLELADTQDANGRSAGWAGLYRAMAKRMHPDQGGPRADWDRLDEARQLLDKAGWL